MKHKLMIALLVVVLALPVGVINARQDTVTIEFWHT